MRKESVCRRTVFLLAALTILVAGLPARAMTLVQDFYLPMPEAQISQANSTIVSGTAGAISSTFSIVVTGDGTVIYYDQWEDGYETDLANPAQSTTQIWGDGNDAHGIPPGFAHNPLGLPAGTVITLTNSVTLPRNPSTILWDARDHVAANKALVITRAGWPTSIGPVFAGAVGVLSTIDYGTNYISPVGQDLTPNLFKYVGLFIMAAQNNTAITIDPNGTGVGTTNIVLNQGESYLVNGGVKKGGRVTATKPFQADLVIGHTATSYAADWFTLYPVTSWDNSYYTAVGSAASGSQPAYVYLFNPATNAITINYTTRAGSGSFAIPGTNGVYQFQMPVGSGASFVSAGGQNFFAICTVAANNTADTSFNWGFTLVPKAALTTKGVVGWGPGSADGTANGSPVWVTTLANTTLYVDYKGDTNGPLVDPNGVRYDTNFTVSALQSLKIYDPSKNQTAMKVYTVDGTLLTAAWGEDPDVASPGNPYIDAGTTVIPFPTPVLFKSAVIVTDTVPTGLSIGDTIYYTVQVDNRGLLPLGNTVVIDTPTTNLTYVTNSTTWNGSSIPDNAGPYNATNTAFPLDGLGSAGYTIPVILSQGSSTFTYMVKVNAAGVVSNSVNIGGTTIFSATFLAPPPTNGASVVLNFTDTNGVSAAAYLAGAKVFVTMTNVVGNSSSNTVQTISVTVTDTNTGDAETIPLVETGTNTGVFRNVAGLISSSTSGLVTQDGTLYVTAGDTLSVSYTDPVYFDSASTTATIQIPTPNKQLYLTANGVSGNQFLNRVNPAATVGHGTTYSSIDIGGGGTLSGWSYRQAITINHANVLTTDQTNFPVLVNLAGNTGLQNHAQASGNDILFTASDGTTLLTYEREKYVSGTGALVAWVKIPILSHTSDTVVYMYYGNSGAPDQQNAAAVWDTNYKGVWHLNQTPTGAAGDIVDSTGGDNGTSQTIAAGAQAAGKIGGSLTLSGTNNYISTATSFANPQTVMLEAWVKTTTTNGYKVVGFEVNQTGTGSGTYDRHIYFDTTGHANFGTYNGGAQVAASTNVLNDGQWHFLVGYRDNAAATIGLYVDGVLQATTASSTAQNFTGWYRIGGYKTSGWPGLGGDGYFAGSVDEIKLSHFVRSAGWIKTEYTNQVSPATFYSIGSEATVSSNTNTTSFAQTPALALPFTLPTGGAVSITNFITITNGVGNFTGNPNITATLQTNGVNFLTLTNPVYTGAAGVTNLVWSGTLTTNYTLPTGTIITYVITNNLAGTAFHVNYDSTNSPSQIVLPASTVIAFSGFGVYDAPYPGGSLVSTPIAGTTLYVRAAVTDPFGSYDITSLGLAFTAPNTNNNFNVTLNDTSAVATNASTKTYEYVWNTGPATGGYTIAATANEGSEGVKANATAGITTIYLDLGTPSVTEFTSGNNGSATNAYLANSNVCVRVNDQNRNTNAATAQLINVTVTSSFGDVENLTLTETGTNTGIFTGCINSTTNTGTALGNGTTLVAPVGNILTVNYSDPTDSSDNTSATATIQPLPGISGIVMNKTIISPSGGQVGIGKPVVYNLQVVNVGSTLLTNVSITDTFTSARLSFASASVTPNLTNATTLTWTNLGVFAPGQSTNITVNFTTLATGTATNSATAGSTTTTNSNSITIAVNSAALNVVKFLLSPTNTPVAVGSNVVFRLTFQNVGNTVINYLPFEDNFSGAYFQYVSATIPANGSGFGSLIWTNIAGVAGLATNAVITNDVTMKVVGQGNPANNTAVVDYATDIFGNPVPTATGSTNVVTAAASITGHVYDDKDQSGTVTAGDTGLGSVTLRLFTDPNGDGNPADGTLVQSTTTDANGYYEFLNLSAGHYDVVVQDRPPGYASVTPTGNQLSVNLPTLTANTNNNFFDYQPSATLYSTISGTVFNDLNGGGTNYAGIAGLAYVSIELFQDVNTNGVVVTGDPIMGSTTTDANGNYSFAAVSPGHYVIRETDFYGYYSTGDSQAPNDSQISFVTTNGITSSTNNFFDRQSPSAVADTTAALYFVATNIYPLTNDISPNSDALTITSATSSNGIAVINSGSTNLTFTPTNLGATTITYTIADAHGGASTNTFTVNVTALADLAIGKTASSSVFAVSNLVYTISVTNLGPTPASSVVVTDALPAGVSFVSTSGGGANISGVVNWTLGSLTSGQITNLTLTVTSPASGTLTNTANVSSPTPDPTLTNNVTPPVITTVTPVADLGIGKFANASVLAVSNLVYTISVTNLGPSTASSVVVTDTLPAGVSFVSASGNGANNSGLVSWSLGALINGQITNLTLTVTAPASGTLTNVANVSSPTGDPNSTNSTTPPVVTTVTSVANLAVGKTGVASGVINTSFSYAISVTNLGPSASASFSVTDSLPAGIVFVSSLPVTTTNLANQAIWNVGALAVNAVTNFTLTVQAVSRATFTNIATAGGPTLDTTPTNNTSAPVVTGITNRLPVAVADSAASARNVAVTIPVLANDSDPDGDALTIISVSPTNGTFSLSGGNIIYTPTNAVPATNVFSYTISDGFGGTATALVTVAVTNRPPVAVNDSASATENISVTVPVLVNDSDPDSDALTIISVSPTNGTAVISGTNVVFTPATNFTGTATCGYGIRDNFGGTNFVVITITVTNIPPTANPDSFAITENTTNSFPVLVNDVVNTSGGSLTLLSVSTTNGVANVSGTNIVFTPTSNFVGTATVGYTITDGIGGTNSSVITVTVQSVADLAVSKSGPAGVYAATNFSYTITVTNFGPGVAANLSVTDNLPAAVSFVSSTAGATLTGSQLVWTNLGSLAANAATNLTVTVTAPVTGVSLTNLAGAGSPTSDPNPTNNTSPPVVTTVTPVADLVIAKVGPASVLATSNVLYTISVTNLGPSTASSVIVTDTLPAGVTFVIASGTGVNNSGIVTWNLGTLANGAASNLTVTVTAPASGSLTNIANVSSPTTDTNVLNNTTPPVVTTVSAVADLAIGKSAPASVFAVSNLTYTISVTNFGPSTASSVTVTDSIPNGASFVNASGGGANNSGTVIWNLGNLANNAVSNLTLTVTAPASGTLTNTATVGSPTGDPNSTNNTTPPVLTSVTPLADLVIAKVGPATVFAASNLSYTISVTNFGPSSASSVVVTDTLPASVTFVSASGNGSNNSGVVTWNLGTLPNGAASNLTVTVTAPASGSLTNIASVSSPTGDTNILNNTTPPVITSVTPLADISVVKSGPAGIIFGTNFNYTITVSNAGPSIATSLSVTDSLPTGLIFVSAVPATTTNASNQIIWNLGNFAAGTGSNLTLTVISALRGSLTNLASSGSPTGDPKPTNNTAPPVVTSVTNNPPVANPDNYAVTENTTNTFSPLLNDTVQTPGGALQIIGLNPTNGTATILNLTNVVFTPTPNFLGTATIGYTITDGVGGTNSSVISVLVTNIPPTANPDSYSITENTTNNFAVLVNDFVNTSGGSLTLLSVSPTNGTANILNLTNIVFTPSPNFIGTATIGYTITDSIGGTNSSVITVTVTNLPPTANAQSVSTPQNTALPITLTGSDPANIPLTFVIVGSPAGGTLTGLNTNTGAVTYTPTNNFSGTDSFTFRVNNGYNNSTTATVTVTVSPVADLVVAQSGPASGIAGANLVFTVAVTNLGPTTATNVVVTNQIATSYTFVSAAANGVTNGNLVTWTIPVLPANGATNFTVTLFAVEGGTFTNTASGISTTPDLSAANNNGSLTNAQVVTTVSASADVAVFKTGTTSVLAGGTVNYSIIATNFGPSTASNVVMRDTLPAGATLQTASGNYFVTNNIIVWQAATLAGGVATNFTVTLTAPNSGTLTNIASSTSDTADPNPGNNDGSSSTSVVVTPVTPVADLSIGKSAAASVLATSNLVYTISVTNLGPSTASSVTLTDAIPVGATFANASGSFVNNSGVLIWSLGNLASGIVSNVTLTVTPPTSGSLTNIATVGSPTSDPNLTNNMTPPVVTTVTPVADIAIGKSGPIGATFNTNFSYTISVTNFGPSTASGILVTDTLPVGVVLASAIPSTTTNLLGQVIWNVSSLAANATTNLSLTVISTARGAVTNFATVGAPTLDPSPTNNVSQPVVTLVTNIPPVANADSYTIAENTGTNTFAPLVNDVVRNPGGVLQIVSVSTTNGSATVSGTNVLFVPGTNYFGSLMINYTITDNAGGTNSSTITVLVTNLPPTANPDNYTIGENSGTNTFSPLVNDVVHTPGGTLQIIGVSPTNGTAVISGTNVLFKPNTNFFSTATIGYTITDGIGGTNLSVITVTVTNIPPVANGQSVGTPENTAVQITLTGSDPNSLPLKFIITGNPANGTLSGLNTNTGAVTYTPGANYTGADSFTFRVNNGQTNSAIATVNLTVTPVADLVVVQSGPASGAAGSNLVFTVSVTNRGPATAISVVVSNQLAAGFTFVSASGSGANSGNLVTWNFASLPANGVTNFTVTAFATEGGTFTNIASGASALLDLNATNNSGSLTNAWSRTTISALADVQIFKDGGTNVYAGQPVSYTITATNAGPSTATSVVVQDNLPPGATFQSASGSYSVSNGVVTWSGFTLAPGTMTTFSLTMLASSSNSFVNIALATSPVTDPNPTNNNGLFAKSRVTTKVAPSADAVVVLNGPASAIQGSNFVYTISITNTGPSTSSNLITSDSLPPGLTFVSAGNGGTVNSSNVVTWPAVVALPVGGVTNYTVTVRSITAGDYTNIVSEVATTFDPNTTNNSGVLPAARVRTTVAPAQFTFLAGLPVFNPQTGLFEETVTVTNNGSVTVLGFRLNIGGLRSGVSLWNANGTNAGVPYINYNFPLDPSNSTSVVLEFYDPTRLPFTNTVSIEVITPANLSYTGTNGSVAVSRVFMDTRLAGDTRFVIEFASVSGKTYAVIYNDNLNGTNWLVATPSVKANANVTQWYDDGPPKTISKPTSVLTRFYRVIQY